MRCTQDWRCVTLLLPERVESGPTEEASRKQKPLQRALVFLEEKRVMETALAPRKHLRIFKSVTHSHLQSRDFNYGTPNRGSHHPSAHNPIPRELRVQKEIIAEGKTNLSSSLSP